MMKKRLFCLLLALLLLTGCSLGKPAPKRFTATFLELFDTVTTVVGFADSQEAFTVSAEAIRDSLEVYHQLFDIYNSYEGINNLKTINDAAGGDPVKVDRILIDLLLDCKRYAEMTGGVVNVAMGSVLQLWHEARNDGFNDPVNAYLPDQAALEEAVKHTDLDNVIIDEAASTVQILDPLLRLDVGAVAKGWATQKIAGQAPQGMLISVGGNVCATGAKPDGSPWVVGIQDPNNTQQNIHTVYVRNECVVTSGDYQRTYMVDGQFYHHIIDPSTLYPSKQFRSVTIICDDSGLADALSTALFILPLEEGRQLAERCMAEAMWVQPDGTVIYSAGFEQLIRT